MASRRGPRADLELERGLEMRASTVPGGLQKVESEAEATADPPRRQGWRLRAGQSHQEAWRIRAQSTLIFTALAVSACCSAAPWLGVWPQQVPLRVLEDTFGPVQRLWKLEPPLLNRTRFESPGNCWRPLMFHPQSPVGSIQDTTYEAWNFGVLLFYTGTPLIKGMALMFIGSTLFPMLSFMGLLCQHAAASQFMPSAVKGPYLRWMPEELLILEQLSWAHETYARKLSPAIERELVGAMRLEEGGAV